MELPNDGNILQIIKGVVQKGKQRGKNLGYPTANIALVQEIPEGIYISQTKVKDDWLPSLTFIGNPQTFGEKDYKAETYILSFHEMIYDQLISIRLLKKIRANKKFHSPEDLVKQMKEDEKEARKYFNIKSKLQRE